MPEIDTVARLDPQFAANVLMQKLGRFVPLNDGERDALRHLSRNTKTYKRRSDLIAQGDKPTSVYLLVEGWAYRYKHLADGSRQIMAYLIPGDMCDVRKFLYETMESPRLRRMRTANYEPFVAQARWKS